MLVYATTNRSHATHAARHTVAVLVAVCFAWIGSSVDARAATAVACVGTQNPACVESTFFASAFQWGVKTIEGGGLLRGVARADARKLGVEFLAKTENGSSALVAGAANAGFSDGSVKVGLDIPADTTLEFFVSMSGAFSGSDFGPPCDHCGGQSPWVSSGRAEGKAEVFGPDQQHSVAEFHTEWDSNNGVTDELEPATLMQVSVPAGMTFSWSTAMTVASAAANQPCLSGAGTCGFPGGAEVDGDFRSTFRMHDFHLYDAETHDEILDFTLTGSDGIDYLAIDRGCGNGVLDDGEQCDDGNIDPGDCCSQTCDVETGVCNDGDPCTGDGICDGAACIGAARFSCPLPCGDANDSGGLSAIDALLALRSAVGTNDCDACRCNANHDEQVTSVDALKILQAATGLDVGLDCPACAPDF